MLTLITIAAVFASAIAQPSGTSTYPALMNETAIERSVADCKSYASNVPKCARLQRLAWTGMRAAWRNRALLSETELVGMLAAISGASRTGTTDWVVALDISTRCQMNVAAGRACESGMATSTGPAGSVEK